MKRPMPDLVRLSYNVRHRISGAGSEAESAPEAGSANRGGRI
jgi:hypothetical protein